MDSESPPAKPPFWKRHALVLLVLAAAVVFLAFWFEDELYTFLFSILFQWSES